MYFHMVVYLFQRIIVVIISVIRYSIGGEAKILQRYMQFMPFEYYCLSNITYGFVGAVLYNKTLMSMLDFETHISFLLL